MRGVSIWTAIALAACAVPSADTHPVGTAVAISYAAETDLAIDDAIAKGQSLHRDAELHYQAAISALQKRTDAVERLVARTEQQPAATRMPYLSLLAHIGRDARTPSELLTKIALAKPPPTEHQESAGQHDVESETDRAFAQAYAAAIALVQRGDTWALSDIYANADMSVAAVAAASASRYGILDWGAIQTLNARGIGGSFQMLPIEPLPDAELGPDSVDGPVEGPQ